jgi:hypothetical protein
MLHVVVGDHQPRLIYPRIELGTNPQPGPGRGRTDEIDYSFIAQVRRKVKVIMRRPLSEKEEDMSERSSRIEREFQEQESSENRLTDAPRYEWYAHPPKKR